MQLNIEDDDFKKAIYCPSHLLYKALQEKRESPNLISNQDSQLKPGEFNKERMEKALQSETFTLPQGLTQEEIIDFINKSAKK